MPAECTCETPKPYENSRGDKTNMCQECHHQIPDPPEDQPQEEQEEPNTIGRVRLQMEIDNAIGELDLSPKESEELAGVLCGKVRQWVRQVHQIHSAKKLREGA